MSIEKLSTNASLKEVMDKFEELSFQDFSSIDIVTAKELPQEVKENKIVIITDTLTDTIVASYFDDDASTENGSIFIKLTTEERENSLTITSKSKKITLNVSHISQVNGERMLASYVGKNGKWIPLTVKELVVFRGGTYPNEALTGSFESYVTSSEWVNVALSGNCLDFSNYAGGRDLGSTNKSKTTKNIDFSSFNTLSFTVDSVSIHKSLTYIIGIGNNVASVTVTGVGTYELDISNINTSDYMFVNLQRRTYYGQKDSNIKISEFLLY